jgi:hypothetical protein
LRWQIQIASLHLKPFMHFLAKVSRITLIINSAMILL